MKLLDWWRWPVPVMIAGQGVLIWGIYQFATHLGASGLTDAKRDLMPWLGWGLGVYLAGRGLQIAAKSRARRLAKEEQAREGS